MLRKIIGLLPVAIDLVKSMTSGKASKTGKTGAIVIAVMVFLVTIALQFFDAGQVEEAVDIVDKINSVAAEYLGSPKAE